MSRLLVDTPNLSVMLPGMCNAKCEFCFWERYQESNKFPKYDFALKVFDQVMALPECFKQMSITGGEPTISSAFLPMLATAERLKKFGKINKVVLTTNGVRLKEHLKDVCSVVDHINISRHHYDDDENCKIYKTLSVPSSIDVFSLVSSVHSFSDVDICFNCVVSPNVSVNFCHRFINYARAIGVKAVSFRIYHNSMGECEAEKFFVNEYGSEDVSTCPVCRTVRMKVKDFCVNWKYSVLEPTKHWNGVYELIIQPDGRLTADWSGNILVDPKELEVKMGKSKEEIELEKEKIKMAKELIDMANKLLLDTKSKETVIREVHHHHASTSSHGGGCGTGHGGGCS